MRVYSPHTSSIFNINANLMALLCYIIADIASVIPLVKMFAFLAPLAIYYFEKNSDLVRFHAAQALALDFIAWLAGLAISLVTGAGKMTFSMLHLNFLGAISSGVGGILQAAIWVFVLVYSIIAMVRAYQYSEYEIPLIAMLSRLIFRPLM